jgi:hypothetical protein
MDIGLKDALDRARGWGFDEPHPAAIMFAHDLLDSLTHCRGAADSLEVAVAVDGSIDITSIRGAEMIIIIIPPSGSRIEMAVQDWKTGQLLSPTVTVSNGDIVRRLERVT